MCFLVACGWRRHNCIVTGDSRNAGPPDWYSKRTHVSFQNGSFNGPQEFEEIGTFGKQNKKGSM